MAKQNINSKKGFTIIEVVLVLAIAGLIFLMVFVALPALQRSQRDTARRNDMSRVNTSLVQYQTNHSSGGNSGLPDKDQAFCIGAKEIANLNGQTVACDFIKEYMNSGSGDAVNNTFVDPDGKPYSIYFSKNWSNITGQPPLSHGPASLKKGKTNDSYTVGTQFDSHMIYVISGGRCNGDEVVKDSARHFAIMYRLEGAGVYCTDDQ